MLEQFSQQAVRSEREQDFDQPVINIGSHPDNDIIIPGQGVLPFHALVVIQDNKRDLVPLTPDSAIRVDGVLMDEPSISITRNQRVEIGNYTLRFQGNGTTSAVRVSILSDDIDAAPLPSRYEMVPGEEAILVNIISQENDIEVQQTAAFELEVVNAGPIVASFYINIQGVPEEWVEIRQAAINLNEGQRALVNIWVTPPREPASTAGRHDITINVSSPNYPGHEVATPFELTIQPYYEFALGNLSPKQQRIPWRKRTGLANLPITNRGNSTTEFMASALDDENGCSFDFRVSEDLQLTRQATVTIESGGDLNLPIEITPLKQKIFALRSRRYHFTTTVQVPQQISSPQTLSASVTSLPLFGWWSIMLGILAILFGLFILLQPRIHTFQLVAGKDVIELGDTTKLEWSVSPFVTRLDISNIDQTLNRGQKSLTIAPSKSTTYELVAGNWLSGLLGLDRKESQTVLVVPPSPDIGVFEVDKTTVDKGTPVNLRWSVTQADQVFLTVDEVVYELPPDQFSGEQEYILEKDALLTLEAVNTSGSELRSYFVNVVPPHITVNAFTVWTRSPETVSTAPDTQTGSGGGHFASRVFVPDANFPEEYVMLIPDLSSDSGYRVEFLQPDRELAKGEQIMLEWDIEGVESVQISPFTEELPSRGVQPFFPQESMNFVMTAKSGELEQIYMLPVKVFDGIPPEAPTIEFFKASPLKMVGAGPVEFAWSVSGEWTRVQLASGEEIVADYLNPQGFKTVNVSKSSTFILTAWNGPDLSSAAPVEITVDPSLIPLPLWIDGVFPDTGRFLIGDKLKVSIDYDKPDDKPDPTGEIIVTDGAAICKITLPAKICDLIFETPGTKSITAVYTGDTIYQQSSSDPYTQTIEVQSAQVDLTALYYFLNDDSTKGAEINDIQKTTLAMDDGLYVTIVVQPKNTTLPLDDTEKISASVCDQDNNCEFVAVATVRAAIPNTDEIVGYGYADIIIPHFSSAGLRDLLFEYRQEDGAIDPANLREEDITIGRLRISLALDACADPDGLDDCRIGVPDPSDVTITYDIKNYNSLDNNGVRKPLSSALPKPLSVFFETQWEDSPGVLYDWVCNVIVKSATYKLECDYTAGNPPPPLPVVSPVDMIYSYHNDTAGPDPNNYYMGGDPDDTGVYTGTFPLHYLRSTDVIIKDMGSLKVGQVVTLTNNVTETSIISIIDANGTEINNDTVGDVTLVETGGKDVFGDADLVENNCTIENNDVVIKSPGGICQVYFKAAGDASIQATYEGDNIFSGNTSGTKQVTIGKQDSITTTWKIKNGGTYNPWDPTAWVVNEKKEIRIELSVNGSFYIGTLENRTLLVKIEDSSTSNCKLSTGGSVAGTSDPDEYHVTISPDGYADFPVRCTSVGKMDISIAFPTGQDADDFAFDPNAVTSQSIDIEQQSTVAMGHTLIRASDNYQMQTGDEFHVGEQYNLELRVTNLWDWYDSYYGLHSVPYRLNENTVMAQYTAYDYIGIDFPHLITETWDTSSSTCDNLPDGSIYKVRLNQSTLEEIYRYFWTYNNVTYEYGYFRFTLKNAPTCKIVLKSLGQTTDTDRTINFEYNSTITPWYQSADSYTFLNVDKQDVEMTFSPVSSPTNRIIAEINTDVVIDVNLTPEIPQTSSRPLNLTTDISVVSSCDSTPTKQIVNARQARVTISTNQPGDCTATVEYNGNGFFKHVNTNNVIYLNFEEPPAATDTSLNITPSTSSTYGESLTLAAHVTLETGTAPKPTGSVQFQNYGANIGSPVALNNQQWAQLITNTLAADTYLITAVYLPEPGSNFETSESAAVNHTIQKAGSTTTLAVSHSPTATATVTVTFTATVVSSSVLDPTGKVEFWDQIPNPDVKLGESQLSNGVAVFPTSSLPVGNHTVVGKYISIPSNFIESQSTGKDIEIIN